MQKKGYRVIGLFSIIIVLILPCFYTTSVFAFDKPLGKKGQYQININLWTSKLEVREKGKTIKVFPVASGKADTLSYPG